MVEIHNTVIEKKIAQLILITKFNLFDCYLNDS